MQSSSGDDDEFDSISQLASAGGFLISQQHQYNTTASNPQEPSLFLPHLALHGGQQQPPVDPNISSSSSRCGNSYLQPPFVGGGGYHTNHHNIINNSPLPSSSPLAAGNNNNNNNNNSMLGRRDHQVLLWPGPPRLDPNRTCTTAREDNGKNYRPTANFIGDGHGSAGFLLGSLKENGASSHEMVTATSGAPPLGGVLVGGATSTSPSHYPQQQPPPPNTSTVDQGQGTIGMGNPPSSRNQKKRARASRRAPTTVLTTDTTNFRAMVQEFTGIPAPPFSAAASPYGTASRRLDLLRGSSLLRSSSATGTAGATTSGVVTAGAPPFTSRLSAPRRHYFHHLRHGGQETSENPIQQPSYLTTSRPSSSPPGAASFVHHDSQFPSARASVVDGGYHPGDGNNTSFDGLDLGIMSQVEHLHRQQQSMLLLGSSSGGNPGTGSVSTGGIMKMGMSRSGHDDDFDQENNWRSLTEAGGCGRLDNVNLDDDHNNNDNDEDPSCDQC